MKRFLHEFAHYSNGLVIDNAWWEIDGDKLVNMVGGWHPYNPKPDDIIVEAEDFSDLDWSCLINDKYDTGYLDLDGNFYGCEPYDHSLVAHLYFKSNERDLEKIGFIKIYHNYDRKLSWYCEKREPTKKQEDYLIEKNLINMNEM